MLFIFWQFFSSLFTPYDIIEVLKRNFQAYFFTLLLITFFYLRSFKDSSAINSFLNTILILFIPVLLYGVYEIIAQFNPLNFYLKLTDTSQLESLSGRDLYQAVSSQTFGQRTEQSSTLRTTSIYGASNNFSINLNIILMVTLYKLSIIKGKFNKGLMIFYSLFVLIMQFTTLARTGVLQLLGVLFTHLLISNKPTALKLRDVIVFSFILLLLIIPFVSLYGERDQGNVFERFFMWNIALKIISEHTFFGIGAGNIMAEFTKRFYPLLTTHNTWLDLLVISGVLGLLLIIGFYLTLIFRSLKIFKKYNSLTTPNKNQSFLINYGLYCLIIILIYSISEPFGLPLIPLIVCFSSFAMSSGQYLHLQSPNNHR